ncbi:glycoside hydrolase family 5 protein [Paenibacillus spongiae]|uniref:mannan endo-1,4-beta-mannosidase n=1 Tax=Paenibacillus spongiae TaxID=2909671 RepID=A0ABY5SDE9_9BACL|nr:glycoside hydrolase family 5 protein [Paenibacillus spongiae]UVI31987.1 glycoside hydrolase family 5 protein [Paenibacillus spongiae]
MKRNLKSKSLFLVILVMVLTVSAPLYCSSASSAPGFITAKGTKLYQQGKEWYLYGASIYQSGGIGWKNSQFRNYIDEQLQVAVDAKLNTVRVLDFLHLDTQDPYDSIVWDNVDYVIQQAEAKGLRVILDLATYRNLLKNQGKFPYDMNDWNAFLDFVGQRYAKEKAIAYYALAGEPDAPNGSEPLRPTTQQLTDFFTQASDRLHQSAPKQLISSGGLSYLDWNSGVDWEAIFSAPNIDIAAVHVYSEGDLNITVPTVAQWAKDHNKPLLNEEFGKQQSMGDAARADYFQTVYDTSRQYELAGVALWNFGPEIVDHSYDVNPGTPLTWQTVLNNSPLPRHPSKS